jgi:hypothetical protein
MLPHSYRERFVEIPGLRRVAYQILHRVDVAALTTPACRLRPPRARYQLRADAWLPRPRAAQPNLNPADTTPITTEYKASNQPRSGSLRTR